MADWLKTEFLGLHPLHWLLSGLVPLLLAVLAIVYLINASRLQRNARHQIIPLIEQIDALSGRTIAHLAAVESIFAQSRLQSVGRIFYRMRQECEELYQNRWLPDLKVHLRIDTVFGPTSRNSLKLLPAARLLTIGILGSLVSLLLQNQIPARTPGIGLGLILLPGLVSLAGAILVAAKAQTVRSHVDSLLQDLRQSMASRLPVFSDQAGLAMLIDRFMEYDRQMNNSLQDFSATARRLADSEMADGIRHSVEQVMLGSVAPAIQQATSTLGSLAGELTSRQERGMQDLAVRFANALSSDLAGHLQPINREIDLMGKLMNDVKQYIEIAMRSLETTRQQSEGLLTETRQALLQMAEARVQLTTDFSSVDNRIKALASSTGQMAELYQGNEQNLVRNIDSFGGKLEQYGRQLESILTDAVGAMQSARQTAADQQDSAGLYLGAMQDQVNNLSSRLGADIQGLLSQIRHETGAVSSQASTIGTQLGALNNTLNHSLNEFSQASAQYVRQTLHEFDSGLAELTERMARTAAEIRDAVDALPAALRHAQGQTPNFE